MRMASKSIQGFTLIEVMVAMIIVAVSAIAAYTAVNQQVLVAEVVNSRIKSQILVWNDAVLLDFNPPQDLSDKKDTQTFLNENWIVERKVQPTLTKLIDKVVLTAYPKQQKRGHYQLVYFLDRGKETPSNS